MKSPILIMEYKDVSVLINGKDNFSRITRARANEMRKKFRTYFFALNTKRKGGDSDG